MVEVVFVATDLWMLLHGCLWRIPCSGDESCIRVDELDGLLVHIEMEYKLVPPTRHFDAAVK